MVMLPQPQVLELLSVDMEHHPPLELICHMAMLPVDTMLLILLELSMLPRERLMLSLRLMLSMDPMDITTLDTTTLDTATLDSQPTPDQLSQLSPELLPQLSPAIPPPLFPDQLCFPEHLESGRERLRLSQRLMP